MYTAYLIQFLATLIIVGAGIRYVELRWPESWLGRTLAVVY